MAHVGIWLSFLTCVVIILFAGRKLAGYGDIIGDRTGLGGLWIGVLLLSVITSLPEVFNGVGATVFVKEPVSYQGVDEHVRVCVWFKV